MSNRQLVRYPLTAKTTTGNFATLFCQDFRNAVFQLHSIAASDQVIKFVISNQENKPDFTAASSATNLWSYAQAIDLNDGTAIVGTTGYTFVGIADKAFEVNTNAQTWVGVLITTGTAGAIAGVADLADNW